MLEHYEIEIINNIEEYEISILDIIYSNPNRFILHTLRSGIGYHLTMLQLYHTHEHKAIETLKNLLTLIEIKIDTYDNTLEEK